MKKTIRVMLLGAPGVGKGTHAVELSKDFGIVHISSGDIFRDVVKSGSGLGNTLKQYMDRGELVPDKIVNKIIIERLKKPDASKGFILDGYPRTVKQAEIFKKTLGEMGIRLDYIINLVTTEEVIKSRLTGRRICKACGANYHIKNIPPKKEGICDSCGSSLYQREDDKEETISHRLAVYEKQTKDLIEYYESKKALTTVDAGLERYVTYKELQNLLRKKEAKVNAS
jgi:adenylate kinase